MHSLLRNHRYTKPARPFVLASAPLMALLAGDALGAETQTTTALPQVR
jgi:hypothetical protein